MLRQINDWFAILKKYIILYIIDIYTKLNGIFLTENIDENFVEFLYLIFKMSIDHNILLRRLFYTGLKQYLSSWRIIWLLNYIFYWINFTVYGVFVYWKRLYLIYLNISKYIYICNFNSMENNYIGLLCISISIRYINILLYNN